MYIGVNATDEFGGSLNSFSKEILGPRDLVHKVKALHDALGVDVIELNASVMGLRPGVMTNETMELLANYGQETGLQYTVHLPFRSIDVGEIVEPVRQASADYQRQLVDWFDDRLPVLHYVLHVQASQIEQIAQSKKLDAATRERILSQKWDNVRRSLDTMLPGLEGERICIENLEYGWEEPYALAAEYDTSICCDVGHLVVQGLDAAAIIRQHLDRIRHFHYHDVVEITEDNVTVRKDHVALGTGLLDIPGTLDAIVNGGFQGTLLLEVASEEFARVSIDVLQRELQRLAQA